MEFKLVTSVLDAWLFCLKKIAGAKIKEDYEDAVEELRDLPFYDEKENVQKYIENTWLSCSFRWARALRIYEADQVINTNNGVEAQIAS